MTETTITAEPGLPFISMSRTFKAPRELVYRAHVDPDLLVQWLGPRDLTMTIDRHEIRDGGVWRFVHRDADGNEHWFRGVYHGEPSPDQIVRTFEYEGTPGHVSLEWATFDEVDGRTTLRMNSVFQSVAARDAMIESGMEHGVNDSMERLEALLASLQPSKES